MIIFIVILIISIIVVISKRSNEKYYSNVTVFKIKKSNSKFVNVNKTDICLNMTKIVVDRDGYENEIPVGEETKALLCVGNKSRKNMKVQITSTESTKYSIRIEPNVITLKPGMAVEFSIFVKPKCTCSVSDNISVVGISLNKAKEQIVPVILEFKSKLSKWIDNDDIKYKEKIGNG